MTDSTDPTALTYQIAAAGRSASNTTSSGGGGASTVSVSNLPACQSVTGTVAVTDGGGTVSVDDGGGSVTVDGAVTVSGTVTANAGTGTMAVSAASLPLPSGAAQDGTDIASPTAMPAGGAGIRGWLSAIWTKLNGTVAVTGPLTDTQLRTSAVPVALSGITNPVVIKADTAGNQTSALKVDGSAVTQPVSLAANTPDVTDRTSRLLGHVTVDTMPTVTITGTVTANAGTGTQATRDLKDTGRTAVILSATAIPSVTSEAMFTLNKWVGGTVTSGTSYTVTAGKTLRVQGIQYGCRFATNSTTVTFANTKINFRSGSTITSPLIYGDSKMAAANLPTPNSDLPVPDGLEFPAGTVLGFSHVGSATTLLLDVVLVGYEY